VQSCVFDKLGCATGEESLWNTGINYVDLCVFYFMSDLFLVK
jgi:hypothetical protein